MTTTGITAPTTVVGRTWAHLQVPLFRNAYALMLNTGLSSVLGMAYWMVAARHYSPYDLGRSSAMLSAMLFVAGLSQLNLIGALVRFVPRAGRYTGRLVAGSYLVSAAIALVVSTAAAFAGHQWAPVGSVLRMDLATGALFVLATVVWCVFTLQDAALTGLRQALWVPLENSVFGLAKIGLLVAFAAFSFRSGLFASWWLPAAVLLVPMNLLIFRRLIPRHVTEGGAGEGIALRQVGRFVAGDYLGSLFVQAAVTLMPLMVAAKLGAGANAHFYVAWTIVTAVDLLASNLAASLTAEAAREEARLAEYLRAVGRRVVFLLIPIVTAVLFAAPLVLSVFGSTYASEGTTLLRLLCAGVMAKSVAALFCGAARVRRRVSSIVAVQAAQCLLLFALSVPGLDRFGITGVGLAYLVSQSVVAVFLLPSLVRTTRLRREGGGAP
jgi:O-antigen/teichoic acid export membrane protein